MHKDEGKQKIAMTMAGKAAEIIKYGEEGVSSGPAGDIQQASALARAMIMRWGMSDKVGNVDYAEAHEGYQGNTAGFSVSAHTKELIEGEVKRLIEEGYDTARSILLEKADDFERLAKGLLEYETLTGDEIRRVIAGERLDSDDEPPKSSTGGGTTSVAAIPKTKPKAPRGGAEPEPVV
jgi:cell division protease FtsH